MGVAQITGRSHLLHRGVGCSSTPCPAFLFLCLAKLFYTIPAKHAGDFSTYRHFFNLSLECFKIKAVWKDGRTVYFSTLSLIFNAFYRFHRKLGKAMGLIKWEKPSG